MEFRLLGPVEARVDERVLNAGHARQRAVLAVLALEAGRVVAADRLIDRVWGEDPPASVRSVLYGYVARLRAVLAAGGEDAVLVRRSGGYVLEAEYALVDVFRFRRLVGDAAAADDNRAAVLLRDALELWRGPALAGVDSAWLTGMRESLERERHAALLSLNEVRLRLGQHGALAVELTGLAAAAPGDERLIYQLMLALYRSGQPAEALRWFEQSRRHLSDELGTDPSPAMRQLHEQILRCDPALDLPSAVPGVVRKPAAPVPRELPPDVSAFTGREAELKALDEVLLAGGGSATAALISAVSGTAGVGKTALAVHWAHYAAVHFPDGQLHVNLCGYDPAQPVSAADALARFLSSLGVPGPEIPVDEEDRAARYRSLLAGKRMLIVLDNAAAAEQVRPLLPGHPECRVVVTSRNSLAGLVARDGARRLDLDLLPLDDAVALLRELVGDRAAAEPEALMELARQCARLPLALRVAAELAAARPGVRLADLVAELADEQRRLDLLSADGDLRTAARAVFSWSYEHLDELAARSFRLIGLHPGADFEAYAVAALTGSTLEESRQALDALTRAHLVQPATPGRYGMHDLLRAYARDLAAEADGEQESRAALTRLFDLYLSAAAAAMDEMYPAEKLRRPAAGPADSPAPPVSDPASAQAWLEGERATFVAIAAHAEQHGWTGHATRLSGILTSHLASGRHNAAASVIHSAARRAASATGDTAAEAAALNALGALDWGQGRYQQATERHRRALALSRRAGDRLAQASALYGLGAVEWHQGASHQAVRHYRHALTLYRDGGDKAGQATTMNALGNVAENLGRYEQATLDYSQALALCREIGDRIGEAAALGNLGIIDERLGRYREAIDRHEQALAIFRQIGSRKYEAIAANNLGLLEYRLGRYREAAGWQRQALAISREVGNPALEADVCNELGVVLLADGRPDDALHQHETALALARDVGHKREQAHALDGLGNCYFAAGDQDRARQQWQLALVLFAELGRPEAERIRGRLAGLVSAEVGSRVGA